MSDSDSEPEPDDPPAGAPLECRPCSGTGKVVSNLGGDPTQVDCPWCEGTGRTIPGHDAQSERPAQT